MILCLSLIVEPLASNGQHLILTIKLDSNFTHSESRTNFSPYLNNASAPFPEEVKKTIIHLAENLKIIVEPGGAVAAAEGLRRRASFMGGATQTMAATTLTCSTDLYLQGEAANGLLSLCRHE